MPQVQQVLVRSACRSIGFLEYLLLSRGIRTEYPRVQHAARFIHSGSYTVASNWRPVLDEVTL
jgi:hypothetical protein